MTRKRKNVESSEGGGGSNGNCEPSYPKKNWEERPVKEEWNQGNSFPQKNWQEEGTFPKKEHRVDGDGYGQQYGYGRQDDYEGGLEYQQKEEERQDKPEYPTDLVAYLRHFGDMIESEGVLDDDAYLKCAEECSGSEERLLQFYDACRVVEKIFCSSPGAALIFLKSLFKLKHKKLLDLFFASSAARSIEKLIASLSPVENREQLEILSKLTDLLCDNWNDVVMSQPSSFLLRCLARVCCGISQPSEKMSEQPRTGGFPSNAIGNELKLLFCRIADLAVDNTSNPASLKNLHSSLVVSEIIDCDAIVGAGRCGKFVEKQLSSGESDIIHSLCGKSSSRVWDRAFSGCTEAVRAKLWNTVLHSHAEELAMDPTGNHPLKNFIASVESKELAKAVCDTMVPLIGKLFSSKRSEVVAAVVKCTKLDVDLQEGVIKELRAFFNANKPSNKQYFFLNALTMNKFDNHFDVNQVDLQGSFLVQALLQLQKVKTLSAGISALDSATVFAMALNKPCAFVLQAVLKSQVEDGVKNHLIYCFDGKWEELASHQIGSRTFEAIWDNPLFTVNKKQEVMKGFVSVRNTSRNWKFAMLRCDMMLFRKDRKAWVAKMKNSKK